MYTLTVNNIVTNNLGAKTGKRTLYFILACVTGLLPPDVCHQVTQAHKHLQGVALWGWSEEAYQS